MCTVCIMNWTLAIYLQSCLGLCAMHHLNPDPYSANTHARVKGKYYGHVCQVAKHITTSLSPLAPILPDVPTSMYKRELNEARILCDWRYKCTTCTGCKPHLRFAACTPRMRNLCDWSRESHCQQCGAAHILRSHFASCL